ncbi:hypothetical protein D4764_15G0010630 [Takifugu flavidus]|uniref:Uncharacterized protein n=1 Tax=Takifugu flavidus TaxID=433684 RepID=A0A5C6P6B5_9TELE|nr:hypothetical protein D4764_15G0010630 [Takifugu flavidus]
MAPQRKSAYTFEKLASYTWLEATGCTLVARERQQEERFLHRRVGKGKRAQRWTSHSALVHRSISSCGGVQRSGVEEEPRDE